ncbi:putative cytochrome P450 133B2 [Paraburkholderia ribeironis]|uniref:Putative cytochrome P450 133B2 n=1 Tax=Paraburkholderia ribeironis TaxID=1247936 RepID=A0A1N7RL20_9BURK|nr:cytochrome P450 [Paraburkholderia ribeironis]SIT35803.1 putative cytochrome P450 133B2 [Paraburkholderia ribeironis]
MNFTDFSSPAFFADPYPLYQQVRDAGPLLPVGANARVTGRFEIIDALLRDRRMGKTYLQSVSARYGDEATGQPVFQALRRTFLMMNPPTHTRLRALLMKAFNARQIGKLRDIVVATAHELVERIGTKAEFDLVSEYALPLPIEIICRLLDIPSAHGTELGVAASRLVSALDLAPLDEHALGEANDAALTLERYFQKVVKQRRGMPGDDLISALVCVEDEGATLSDEEIVSNAILLFIAGHETTSNMIGNAMVALFRQPARLDQLKRDPALIPQAVAECMRYDSSVQMVVRTALEDVVIGDAALPAGTIVFMLIGAANRDPAVFPNPDQLDFNRGSGTPTLSFGGGIHYCLGARLALLEMEAAITSLVTRFPDMRPINLDQLAWHSRNNLRGVQSLKMISGAG